MPQKLTEYSPQYGEEEPAVILPPKVNHSRGNVQYARYAKEDPSYRFSPPVREARIEAAETPRPYYEMRAGKGTQKGKGYYAPRSESKGNQPMSNNSGSSSGTLELAGASWEDAPQESWDESGASGRRDPWEDPGRGAATKGQTWDEGAEGSDAWDEARAPPPFKVSASSDVRIVAGAIASAARRGRRGLLISACGAASINQAVKSIAVTRAYLKDDIIDIDVCGVFLAEAQEFKHLIYIDINFVHTRMREPLRQKMTHKVSGSSVAGKVAGAIASSLRDGECCQVSVVGADAMMKAVLAISICAKYMERDPYPPNIVFWPDFDTIYVDGERRSGVSLYVIPVRKRAM